MVKNELYKIIIQRSIIFFIVSFCIFNGVYLAYEKEQLPKESYENIIKTTIDISDRKYYLENTISKLENQYADEKVIAEYEKARNYFHQINGFDDYIDSIIYDKKGLNHLLYNENSFATKNKENIKKVYIKKNMAQVKPVYGNYAAIERSTNIGIQDIFLIFIILMIPIILLTREKETGMIKLQKANINGRTKQILSKQTAGIIITSVLSVIVYGETFVVNILLYGTSSLRAPIQSVNGFFASTLKMNIIQYIFLFIIIKTIILCVFVLLAYLISNIFRTTILTCITYASAIIMEYLIYARIGSFSNTSVFKYLNICSLLNVKDYMKSYTNLNICNNPLPYGKASIFAAIILIILIFVINIAIFNKSRNDKKTKRLSIFKMKNNHSLYYHEVYKALICNKIFLIIIIATIIQIFTYKNITVYEDSVDYFYNIYVEKINGTNNLHAEEVIQKEENKFKKLEKDLLEAQEAFEESKITETGYENVQSEYNAHRNEREALKQLIEQRDYLIELRENKKINGWFLNEKAYKKIFYMDDSLTELKDGLIMLSLLIFIIIPMVVADKEKKTDILFSSTKLGRKVLWNRKILAACTSGLFVFVAVYVPRFYYVIKNLEYKATNAPIQSMKEYYNFPLELSVQEFFILSIILKLLCVIIFAITILSISASGKTLVSAIVACVGVVVLLTVPVFLGLNKMYNVLFIPLLTLNRTMLNINGNIIVSLILSVLGMIWISVRGQNKFCKIGNEYEIRN